MANILPLAKKKQILHMLCEGSSMRSISRIVDCSINTVTKMLVETGAKCDLYQYNTLRKLPCKRVQVDEIWAFCYGKKKKLPPEKANKPGYGDIWTWTAVCPDTKAVLCWHVGTRELSNGTRMMRDLKERIDHRIQISSDGHHAYTQAVEAAFGGNVDFGMLVKDYNENDGLALSKGSIIGNPKPEDISTSMVERQNLSMRMGMRRFTRKTNAHSKKIENHNHALALYFMYFNFCKINSTLRITPAMALGITDHVWEWEEVIAL